MSPADVNAYYNSPNNYIGLLPFNPQLLHFWLLYILVYMSLEKLGLYQSCILWRINLLIRIT